MNLAHSLLYSYPPHLMVESAKFDGSAAYMSRGAALTGIASSKTGIFSAWIRIDGTDNTKEYDVVSSSRLQVIRTINIFSPLGNSLYIHAQNSSGTDILAICTNSAYTQSTNWHHLLGSWDLSASSVNLYVDDVSNINATKTVTNDTIDYASPTNWYIGANAGVNLTNGCVAELYFAPGQYLDFSVTNNRRKFITSSLKPVYLGKDGAGPTGTAPAVYFHLDPSEALADFATNRGTGGNFTITGSLTAGSTSPSDF